MTPLHSSDGVVWLSPPRLAIEFNKNPLTVRRWCYSGFILSLGYKLQRGPKGHWMIGVPLPEYRTFRSNSLDATASSPVL